MFVVFFVSLCEMTESGLQVTGRGKEEVVYFCSSKGKEMMVFQIWCKKCLVGFSL